MTCGESIYYAWSGPDDALAGYAEDQLVYAKVSTPSDWVAGTQDVLHLIVPGPLPPAAWT